MLDVFRFKSTRKIVSLVGVLWPAVMFFDFTVFLNLEKSGSDVYLHGIVVFIACAVAALIAGALADYFGRKKVLIASIFMSCIPYVITPYCSQHENLIIVETILLFISCISIETAFTVVVYMPRKFSQHQVVQLQVDVFICLVELEELLLLMV